MNPTLSGVYSPFQIFLIVIEVVKTGMNLLEQGEYPLDFLQASNHGLQLKLQLYCHQNHFLPKILELHQSNHQYM